jgi:beta-1,4-N-acetylglucosaminyltransferase
MSCVYVSATRSGRDLATGQAPCGEMHVHKAGICINMFWTILSIITPLVFLTALILLRKTRKQTKSGRCCKTMIVLGSGGHTAEMMILLSTMNKAKYKPRIYVSAKTDILSQEKAQTNDPLAVFETIPRAREVKQSLLSTVASTIWSTMAAWPMLLRHNPDLILCNGPGSCVPLCLVAWFNNKLGLGSTKIVFVESVCRVKTFSLSGKILTHFANKVLVQWPSLVNNSNCDNVSYVSRFV